MKEKLKNKEVRRQIVLAAICLILMIVLVFAWFAYGNDWVGVAMNYDRTLYLASINIKSYTYYGEEDETGAIVYETDPISSDKDLSSQNRLFSDSFYPSQRQYFKTVIYNSSTVKSVININLKNIKFDEVLNGMITVGCTSPQDIATLVLQSDTNKLQNGIYTLNSVNLITHQEIPAGEEDGASVNPGKTEIYWYIEASEELTNSAMGAEFTLDSMEISYG